MRAIECAELATCLICRDDARGDLAGDLAHDVSALRSADERKRAEGRALDTVELARITQRMAMGEMAVNRTRSTNLWQQSFQMVVRACAGWRGQHQTSMRRVPS
jgi:hypothetical protein